MHSLNDPFLNFTGLLVLLTLLLYSAAGCKNSETAIEVLPDEHGVGNPPAVPSPELPPPDQAKEKIGAAVDAVDIDSLLASMSLREKIGQLFFIPVNGRFHNEHDPLFMEWKRLISRYHVGGLIFMAGDIYGQAAMTRKMQEISRLPLWITQDMEFGAAMRVRGTTRFTPAMGIAATGNPQNAFLKGQITAREARALGVHQIFAPVLDVNNNPENPVINVRSFSAAPEMVAEYGQAFIRGVESEGVLATAKHFPGHGDTHTDSHLALPVIHHDYARLDTVELKPFRSAIAGNLRSVMSAHIAFPAVGSSPQTPGTLDPLILSGILADTLGFDGLVVTDGLEMRGITSSYSPGEAVVRSLEAGADVMLISPDEMTAVYELEKAVERGRLSEQRVERSARKILRLKTEQGLFSSAEIDLSGLSRQIHTPDHRSVADRIARESITLAKNNRQILPVSHHEFNRIVVVSVADDRSGDTGHQLAGEIRKYHPDVGFHVLDQRTGSEEKQKILEDARRADLLVIGSFIQVRSNRSIQLTPDQREFLAILERLDIPSVLIAFGNPYVLRERDEIDVHMLAWSGSVHQIKNTVPALFGGAEISGRLPVGIPGMYQMGDGLFVPHSGLRLDRPESVGLSTDSLMALDMIMQAAVEDSVFPGGTVAVVKDGVLAWHKGYGYHDYEKTEPVQETDIFDLASVTKVMATTTSIMKLYDEGKLHPDDPVARYIPEFNKPAKREITIRHLLLHTSGLPAFRTYVDRFQTRDEIIRATRNEPLTCQPGEKYVYSDLGYIILGEIVEVAGGERLDGYVRNQFFGPMDMHSAHFNPFGPASRLNRRMPPTEIDEVFGRGRVQGYVHDERAYFMDGTAGHAGLFGSARDLAIWAQMLLNGGYYSGNRYLSPETVGLFTSLRSTINSRGYGFARKGEEISGIGTLTGGNTFGHTGFTGTSIWIDPDTNMAIILLTNRSFPHRSYGSGIQDVRANLADAVIRSIMD